MELWMKGKYSILCCPVLVCGLMVIVLAVMAATLLPRFVAASKMAALHKNDLQLLPTALQTMSMYLKDDNWTPTNASLNEEVLLTRRNNVPPSKPDINECTRNPCQHGICAKCQQAAIWNFCQHGTCVNQDAYDGYKTCTCSPGWTGQNCQQNINECTKNPCQHGTCVNQDGGYKSTCSPGWTGLNCQQDINECTGNPCQHGSCHNEAGGYTCSCYPGWTGQNCRQDIDECGNRENCQHGTCVNQPGGYKCTCTVGWSGRKCHQGEFFVYIDECRHWIYCQHGTCENQPGGHKCSCARGWDGQNCHKCEISPSLPCPDGWRDYNNHCYKFVTDYVRWDDAKSACEGMGAKLTSIGSKEENDFLSRLVVDDQAINSSLV
ncbi:hypothetical protein Bbelb_000080 [Branchiostoma belcheri]|nr:hypothetical protein Bbelb_000080 [Branchiostoma belcheri]